MPHYNVMFLCTGNSARSIMGGWPTSQVSSTDRGAQLSDLGRPPGVDVRAEAHTLQKPS
jgi:hypothetical protein